jgi:hypothetical protein
MGWAAFWVIFSQTHLVILGRLPTNVTDTASKTEWFFHQFRFFPALTPSPEG